MAEVETATSLDKVSDPQGKDTLDLKISAAYSKILHGELGAHMDLLEQKAEVAVKNVIWLGNCLVREIFFSV